MTIQTNDAIKKSPNKSSDFIDERIRIKQLEVSSKHDATNNPNGGTNGDPSGSHSISSDGASNGKTGSSPNNGLVAVIDGDKESNARFGNSPSFERENFSSTNIDPLGKQPHETNIFQEKIFSQNDVDAILAKAMAEIQAENVALNEQITLLQERKNADDSSVVEIRSLLDHAEVNGQFDDQSNQDERRRQSNNIGVEFVEEGIENECTPYSSSPNIIQGKSTHNITVNKNGNTESIYVLPREHERDIFISLPESTHTLLHTEPIRSLSFVFALGIATLSVLCLALVLANELSNGSGSYWNVPAGVGTDVRVAQYCGAIVGLLMEEEIPQGLILLRSTSRSSFYVTYPQLSHSRFVLSCIFRIIMGYLFLLNLFVTLVQASDVLTIFFNILALEFVQKLDDVAFELARKDMLGRRLFSATVTEYKVLTVRGLRRAIADGVDDLEIDDMEGISERVRSLQGVDQRENEYSKHQSWVKYSYNEKRCHILLKAVYFLNIVCLVVGITIIGENQSKGIYRCQTFTIDLGEPVWEHAIVRDYSEVLGQPVLHTLVYSSFNGIYKLNGTNDGYPKYTEQNKLDGTRFKETIGAEIKYCKSEEAWVLAHPNVIKHENSDNITECPWLVRSPKTTEYNLADVPSGWSFWTGVITTGHDIVILCDECEQPSDCNYHGTCMDSGICVCNDDESYFGAHCEFDQQCDELVDDEGERWELIRTSDGEMVRAYERPIYQWVPSFDLLLYLFTGEKNSSGIVSADDNATDSFSATLTILYSGSRWVGSVDFKQNEVSVVITAEYHSFWFGLFGGLFTYMISDPATGSTPVGVDIYEVSDNAERYGPFGLLKPAANLTGQGYFHCSDNFNDTEII